VASVAVLAPVAVGSLGQYLFHRTLANRVHTLTPPATPVEPYTRLHVEILSLDELGRQVTLRVAGNHICDGCGYQTRVVFTALRSVGTEREGLPPQAAISLPAASDQVTTDLRLPIEGDLIAYPFDRYGLRLGLGLQRLLPPTEPNGPSIPETLAPAEATGRLFVTLEEQVPQVDIVLLTPAAPAGALGPAQPAYLAVNDIALERPAYLKVEVVLLVALVAAGAVYAVWVQPLVDVLTKVGGLVLSVWGIRSLLLGPLPPYATTVDAVLTLVILTVLSALTLRALYFLHDRGGLRLLPGRRGPQAAPATSGGPVGGPGGGSAAGNPRRHQSARLALSPTGRRRGHLSRRGGADVAAPGLAPPHHDASSPAAVPDPAGRARSAGRRCPGRARSARPRVGRRPRRGPPASPGSRRRRS
jgi:hypothetical protein